MSTTFIQRHGLVQYAAFQRSRDQYPLVKRCEICRSPSHRFYQFDHCHAHGWVRGILCAVCNRQMYQVDEGKLPGTWHAKYRAYQALCPDCKLGKLPDLTLVRQPRQPAQPRQARTLRCPRCKGCGFIWSTNFRRMFACRACQEVTLSDGKPSEPTEPEVTHSD